MRQASDVVGLPITELDTPALLLDLDVVEANIRKMAANCREWGVALRPHAKTHKTPEVARLQLEGGAIGITCAKLGEAEVLVDGGIDHILISTEIVGAEKLQHLMALAQRRHILTVVDDRAGAEALSEAATEAGITLDTLVDVNVGMGRTGVTAGEPACELARRVAGLPGLRFAGLQGYEGNLQFLNPAAERGRQAASAMELLLDTAKRIQAAGIEVGMVSTGGTGTSRFVGQTPGVTEIQAGSYVVMDSRYAGVEGVDFEHAITVLTSVLSRAAREDAVIVDAGLKTLSTDHGPAALKGSSAATYEAAGDEHGRLVYASGSRPALGDKLELIPSHCDTTINLHDTYYVVRDGEVVAVWPIASRGRIQ
jgi:D-serine deaminase-like pyridoxal phosphate-dependent protein